MAHTWKNMTMGTCYYPEHWPKEMWKSDLERMLDAGITVIRIAEFAWNKFEPEEGVFTFGFFREFLDLCADSGMKVIFSTPTATPPAWLTKKYPEVLNCRMDGVPYPHGSRRHYNYNSAVYRRLSARIVEKIADAYAAHPAIVGWQIDNEFNCETDEFYSEADAAAFRVYLKKRHGTLEALNRALGTTFWNQTYTDWEQLDVPRISVSNGPNPHLVLEYHRFVSESALSFCRMQADLLRKYVKPGDFITTNGMFRTLDNHRMTRESLDVYTYDCYPNFAFAVGSNTPAGSLRDRWSAKNLTEVRSICPHFGVMEQQSGANGWTTRMEAPAPRPGQLTLWAMLSVAHGADFVSFFRWRTCTIGTEIYWHGILDYDSRDNRKLREVKQLHGKLTAIDEVCGADYVAPFAVLRDYDNDWDAHLDRWHGRVQAQSLDGIHEASARNHIPYNVVYTDQPGAAGEMAKYPVLIYPHPVIVRAETADMLKAYVENGGTLMIGCRSGYKDADGHCVMLPQPGLLQPLTGTDVRDFTFTNFAEPDSCAVFGDQKLEAPLFNDILTPLEGASVLAAYGESYYRGEAALVENRVGKGRVLHWGSVFTKDNVPALLACAGAVSPFAGIADAPDTLDLVLREKNGRRWMFVLNHQFFEVSFTLKQPGRDLYTGKTVQGEITLPPFGTMVIAL